MSKKKQRAGTVLVAVGSVLIISCAALFWWNHHESAKAKETAEQELVKVENTVQERIQKDKTDKAAESETDSSSDKSVLLPKGRAKRMPVAEIDGFDYIGYLTIPSISLKLPVMNSYDDLRLSMAPCRYYGSLETDDLVIAGHNYYGTFNELSLVSPGDEVVFTNMDGEEYTYSVGDIEVLFPNQVKEMTESKWDLTIYTCNYSGSARFTVRCAMNE